MSVESNETTSPQVSATEPTQEPETQSERALRWYEREVVFNSTEEMSSKMIAIWFIITIGIIMIFAVSMVSSAQSHGEEENGASSVESSVSTVEESS